MKTEELEDLQIYSKVLSEDFTTISVLTSILESHIRRTQLCINSFKGHVEEIPLKNAGKNH